MFAVSFIGVLSGTGLLVLLAVALVLVCCAAPRTFLGWFCFGEVFSNVIGGIFSAMASVIAAMLDTK